MFTAGGVGFVGEVGLDGVEALGAGFEMGGELVFDEAPDEVLHGEFRQIVVLTRAGSVVELDGTELAEGFESTGDRAAGDAEPRLDLVEGERLRAAVEQTLDLADGARQPDERSRPDEAVDHGDFPGGKRRLLLFGVHLN